MLLTRKRFSAITVQEIIDEADVGRSTFYAHYQGKEDLMQALVDSICDHALSPVEPEQSHDYTGKTDHLSAIEHILCHIKERDSGVRALLRSDSASEFTRHLRSSLVGHAQRVLPEHPAGAAAQVSREFLARHLAGGMVELILNWAEGGFCESEHDLAQRYLTLVEPLFVDGLQRKVTSS